MIVVCQENYVSIRCFATGTPQPTTDASIAAQGFNSLLRDRYSSTSQILGAVLAPNGFQFAASRQVLLNDAQTTTDNGDETVSIRCFATGTPQLTPKNGTSDKHQREQLTRSATDTSTNDHTNTARCPKHLVKAIHARRRISRSARSPIRHHQPSTDARPEA